MPCPFIGPKLFWIDPNCFEKDSYFMNIGLNKKFSNENTWSYPKLYIPSTLNIDLILYHTKLIVWAENVKSWLKSWVIYFTFQA